MTNVRMDSKWPDVSLQLEAAAQVTVEHVTAEVLTEIDHQITTQNLVDTGHYRRSWLPSVEGLTGVVGSDVEYGVYLEYGHYTRKAKDNDGKPRSFVLARPHVTQAAKNIVGRIAAIAKDSFR